MRPRKPSEELVVWWLVWTGDGADGRWWFGFLFPRSAPGLEILLSPKTPSAINLGIRVIKEIAYGVSLIKFNIINFRRAGFGFR